MGLLDAIRGSRVYLDANVWIYALEQFPSYSQPLADLFTSVQTGSLVIVTSELSLSEILVRPIAVGDTDKQEIYTQSIVRTKNVVAAPVERSILIGAAKIRAETKLKLPDAIHAATAIATSCTTFLTNDKQFRTVRSINTVLLAQAVLEPDSD